MSNVPLGENELPADTEQCPPKTLALGLDHSDFLAALAPNLDDSRNVELCSRPG